MQISLDLPKEFAATFQTSIPELERFALEAFVIEAYRQEILSRGQLSQLLGLDYWQTEAFLSSHQVFLYNAEDYEEDKRNHDLVFGRLRAAA